MRFPPCITGDKNPRQPIVKWSKDIVVRCSDTHKLLQICGMNARILILFLGISLFSCTQREIYRQLQGETMGTSWNIKMVPGSEAIEIIEIQQLLDQFNRGVSTYIPESSLSNFNASDSGRKFEGDEQQWMKRLLETSKRVHALSNGAFDPSASAVFNAWGFGEKSGALPDSGMVDSLLEFTGLDAFVWEGNDLIKSDPRASLNFNAIAKGYGVDVLCELLDSGGVHDYYVEIGGEVRCKGKNAEGKPWTIGINRPEEGSSTQSIYTVIQLTNQSVATSGNYRNIKEVEGRKWSHTIDPRTGYPIQSDVLSASIIANDCMTADALATSCMVMGAKACLEMVNQLDGVEAYLIGSDEEGAFTEQLSKGMKALIKP